MAKITILEADYSGGTAGWRRCLYKVNISSVKDPDLKTLGGIEFTISAENKKIRGSTHRVRLGVSAFREFLSTHPDFSTGEFIGFNLTTPFTASVASLNAKSNTITLRNEFAKGGVELSDKAIVNVVAKDTEWSIVDGVKIHTLLAHAPSNIKDSILVRAEIPISESKLMANQDIAEVDLWVRAVKGEPVAKTIARINNLYTSVEDKVKQEYVARYNNYGVELNPG